MSFGGLYSGNIVSTVDLYPTILSDAGLAAYLGYAWIERQVARAQKSHATEYMEKMDGEALKKICGNVSHFFQPVVILLQQSHPMHVPSDASMM